MEGKLLIWNIYCWNDWYCLLWLVYWWHNVCPWYCNLNLRHLIIFSVLIFLVESEKWFVTGWCHASLFVEMKLSLVWLFESKKNEENLDVTSWTFFVCPSLLQYAIFDILFVEWKFPWSKFLAPFYSLFHHRFNTPFSLRLLLSTLMMVSVSSPIGSRWSSIIRYFSVLISYLSPLSSQSRVFSSLYCLCKLYSSLISRPPSTRSFSCISYLYSYSIIPVFRCSS